ncbi:DegV family protein [Chloroflexota bacterium]
MIKLVTDSTAYLPEERVRELDIRVVPLCVHFGQEICHEGIDITGEEFYARLKSEPELPTTSQPSAGEFLEVFKELHEAGHEIVCLTISSKISGTWNSALAAKDMLPEADISVVDSLYTTVALQLMVEAAAETIGAGATREEVVKQVEEIRGKMLLLFVVDTLEFLAKGGRIGNARALLGTVLKVKPILVLQEGAIEPLEQVRTKKKAVARMEALVQEHLGDNASEARLGITHALVPEEAEALKKEMMQLLGCQEPLIHELGPVIGTHTGPGLLGIAAYA